MDDAGVAKAAIVQANPFMTRLFLAFDSRALICGLLLAQQKQSPQATIAALDKMAAAGKSPKRLAQYVLDKAPAGIAEPPKFSPANIGGGGRIERDFYREWLKKGRVPMIEGYSLLDAAKQEVRPWPEIGGKGLYLNFSGNVHMDGVIQEIPAGKALEPKRHFYEQIVYLLAGCGDGGPAAPCGSWHGGGLAAAARRGWGGRHGAG